LGVRFHELLILVTDWMNCQIHCEGDLPIVKVRPSPTSDVWTPQQPRSTWTYKIRPFLSERKLS